MTKPIFSNSGKRYSPITSPRGGLYLERRFNGGFFYVTGLGCLYFEGLIFGILRHVTIISRYQVSAIHNARG